MARMRITKTNNFKTYYPPWLEGGRLSGQINGTADEWMRDDRSPLVRNGRKGRWRNPSNYTRWIEEGDVYTVYGTTNSVKTDGSRTVGSGNWDCSGYWYRGLPSVPSYLEDNAIIQALTKLKKQNINFSVALGERKQTANLVADSCKRLAGMVLHTRRTAFKLATDPFALWLEIQYGWKPLLSDVHGAVTELMNHGNPEKVKVTVVGSGQDRFYAKEKVTMSPGTAVDIDRIVRAVTSLKVRLDYIEKDNSALATLSREGLTNPLTLAWELLPFSFVVDWFIPIGKYFDCLDAALGWQFKGGTKSVMQRMNYYATNPRNTPGTGFSGSNTVRAKAHVRKLVRTTYGSSPLPTLPHFSDKKSSMHVANGIALLGAAFTTKLR